MAKVISLEISFLAHATENAERLVSSVARELGLPGEAFEAQVLEGHFGNPIAYYKTRVLAEEAEKILLRVIGRLSEAEVQALRREVSLHLDKYGHLFIRLDKQSLSLGAIRLATNDPIRVRAKPAGWSREPPEKRWRWLLEKPPPRAPLV